MKRTLLVIILAVSLAFNILFAAGYLQARKRMEEARTFRGRSEALARQLELDAEQYEVFNHLRDEFEQLSGRMASEREVFINELIKEKPDQKILEDFCVGKSMKQIRLERLALMQRFVSILRQDQRAKLVERVKNRSARAQ